MSQRTKIIIGVVALILGAAAIGWLYFQLSPDAWDSFVADMSGDNATSRPAAQPVVQRPSRSAGDLLASGSIEAEEVTLAAELGGRIVETTAAEGDNVDAGDLLLRLDQATLLTQQEGAAASVSQAEAGLAAAQADLDRALAGATPDEIAAAEAAVLTAEGAVAAAEAALIEAQFGADSARTIEQSESSVAQAEAALAQAEGAVAAAKADLARANAELARLRAGARPEEIAMYEAQLAQAEALYLQPRTSHDELINHSVSGVPEEMARYQMQAAAAARDAAQAQLDLARAGASSQEIAAALAAVDAAQAQVTIAEAGRDAAEAALGQAQAAPETSEDTVGRADAGVAAAQAQVKVAEGQLAQAQAALDRLRAGATEQEIAMLRAQVAQADAAKQAADASRRALELQLERTMLRAPSGGVILERLAHEGELAVPGAPLFTLADLDQVTLTVYVPEADLGRVALGQAVDVTVDAYDQVFPGQVTHIASQAEFTPKNVQTQEERVHMVFAVKIRLDNPDQLLKPGMPADAVFGA
ncbi:MAG: efflux RND transporter periplasmic adaptor subunit [Chloroflexota bacterium]|jgi:multidrug resistance efflux pump